MSDVDVHGPYGPTPRSAASESAPRRSMRQRLARLGTPRSSMARVLDPLLHTVSASHPRADLAVIERAYQTAEFYHRDQTRKSGDPYITHPLAVTQILAELGMTEPTLCAALLHDTVEDTAYTMAQLESDFGEEVARLVDGVTKLDKITYGDAAKAETLRKMIVAMSRDIRVLVIKLADRLHNMRTLEFLRQEKQERIARETLEIFAPLAHRLGMNTIKWELEDLAFSTIEPDMYAEIARLVAERQPRREEALRTIIAQVQSDLKDAKIKAQVYGRPKHYYSIYQKMVNRGREFNDIYDLIALRILVDSSRDCYAALGVMHVRWNPLPGRFKDYIAMPKFNLYQSLHTTVLVSGRPVELQIRTHDMHRDAEYGVAAHWKYKRPGERGNVADLNWVARLHDWQRESADPDEFLDDLRYEIQSSDVYVYTPKGEVIALPSGSTPVDFAYSVHTQVGHATIGARVNGRLVPLDHVLTNGDSVEVITSKSTDAGPSRDWLSFVRSPRARNKIRQHFTRERRDEAVESGKDLLAKQLRKEKLPLQRILSSASLTATADTFGLRDVDALYAAIGDGSISAAAVIQRVIASEGGDEEVADDTQEERPVIIARPRGEVDAGIEVQGDVGMEVKLAQCCMPVPGDKIVGFVTRQSGVSVHRVDCTNMRDLQQQEERLIEVNWASDVPTGSYVVRLRIEGIDRAGLFADVSRVFADHRVNLLEADLATGTDRMFAGTVAFETANQAHLSEIMKAIRKVPGVYNVFRANK